MPKTRPRLTEIETKEQHYRLLHLQESGIITGNEGTGVPQAQQSNRFNLKQVDSEYARVYLIPNGDIAVVVSARLIVHKSGALIADAQMTVPWDHFPLDMTGPTEYLAFPDLIKGWPKFPPIILNEYMTGDRQLPSRPCRLEGLIIATGPSNVPPYDEEASVHMELSLIDEQHKESVYQFSAQIDRSLIRRFERAYEGRKPSPRVSGGLYGSKIRSSGMTDLPRPNLSESDNFSKEPHAQSAKNDQMFRSPHTDATRNRRDTKVH